MLISSVRKIIFNKGLIEQSLNSLLNFIIILVYGNLLNPSEFATFIVIFSGIGLVFLIVTGIWAAPVLVFLPTKFKDEKYLYIKSLLFINIISSSIFGVISLMSLHAFVKSLSFTEFVCGVLIIVTWSTYELLRKTFYAIDRLGYILIGSCIIVFVFLVGNFIVQKDLDINMSLFIIFISYFIAMVIVISLVIYAGKGIAQKHSSERVPAGILLTHWNYAKWTTIGNICYWLCTQGYFVLIVNFVSDAELGGLRTSMNLLGLITILLVLFENKITPKASRIYFNQGIFDLKKYVYSFYKARAIPFVFIIIIATLVAYFSYPFIFGNGYSEFAYLTVFFGVYQLLLGINRPAVIGLRALNITKPFFVGNLLCAFVTLGLGIVLTSYYGVVGAVSGIVIATLVLSGYFVYSFYKVINKKINVCG
ncbi:hypothetical protein bcgnr5390_30110 [Bacillus luti]|uniref:lipopolysaccharide biosynthesis protein n=1 Tax=Bacillus luti TaxID=2026191 RepID=UPI00289D98AB|nr:hypothetical protein [Bacillus luti]